MTGVLLEEVMSLAADARVPWQAFEGKTIVVTGATGLIGKTLVGALLEHERLVESGLRVIAPVRNLDAARALFGTYPSIGFVPWDAHEPFEGLERIVSADFVFHGANITSSAAFVERPVDVILTTTHSTEALLELARRTGARFCQLSTMEVYGETAVEGPLREDAGGHLDPMSVRNCYPEAKRLDEALCAAYASQHGTSAVVVRLAQTFGPGVPRDDGRVFAYLARCAVAGEDIVLLTDGSKQNSYLYTADAASALLTCAAYGQSGVAYNAANDRTFCSVRSMAHMVAERFGHGACSVRLQIDEEAAQRFRRGSVLRLDTSALEELGWRPTTGLDAMFERMIASWQDEGVASACGRG